MTDTIAKPSVEPLQRVIKVRRDYNTWVANETLEDYALRFTPHRFRKWSELRVANTAFGAASFLVLEAVGATMLVHSGFINTFWAILATGLIIFLIGLPISHAAARHGLDMDLLTRGAGFGYIGSTITSLIYASFTFIFFALEAAIMAYALELAFRIPPSWGYLICALVVVPLVTHGVTAISRLQAWTQPVWLGLLILPYVFLLVHEPEVVSGLMAYAGENADGTRFSMPLFGAALTVGIALVTQMGEQADYLRFMPERTAHNRKLWWLGVLLGGPGWILPGVAKMFGGALLDSPTVEVDGVGVEHAVVVEEEEPQLDQRLIPRPCCWVCSGSGSGRFSTSWRKASAKAWATSSSTPMIRECSRASSGARASAIRRGSARTRWRTSWSP